MVVNNEIRRWPNLLIHKYLHERSRSIGEVAEKELRNVFATYQDRTVFVHAGLSDINSALTGNPYKCLLSVLENNFRSILAPGFTDYFRKSGVYAKKYSKPMYGKFNELFLNDAEYRTNDACKSILVRGDYRFDDCNHHRTYSTDGCFAQLEQDDVLIASVGTPWLMCSFLHYIEAQNDVPYMIENSHKGVLIHNDEPQAIEQKCHFWEGYWRFNKLKLQRQWEHNDIVDSYDLNGLRLFFTSASEMYDFVNEKLDANKYYLVT